MRNHKLLLMPTDTKITQNDPGSIAGVDDMEKILDSTGT
jgi:hypothetical protein